ARFFVNIGFADTLGSGVRNLYRYSKIYSGKEPELIEGDIFQTIIPLNRTQDAPANVSNDVPNEEIAKSIVGHQLAEYRDAKLKKMIKHCYETVPYYTQLFNEGEVNPNSIKSLEDLRILPILTKSIVNKNPEDFISTAIPKSKMVTMHTSGTTGSSFVFQTTQEVICEQWAVWWRYRRALGIEFGTEQAMFGTQRIVPVNQHKPPYWRYNKANHQTYFSACCTSTGN
ncbi:MAG: hypothetical protein LBK67_00150, partial [Coriobacteriales bacterium]|nr:hypothetical protein [Coriobacteriales bacterium]